MTQEYEFNLTKADMASSQWKKMQAHLQHLLKRERIKNDNKMSSEDTAFIRGKISLLKELTKLDVIEKEDADET